MVMAHCLVQRLTALSEHVEVHVAAPKATAPIAARMREVVKVHEADFVHGDLGLGARMALGKRLRLEQYQRAYVLPNSWKSALVPWLARIPHRIGWQGEMRIGLLNDRRVLDEAAYPLMIERFMALADDAGTLPEQPYPEPALAADAENAQRLIGELNLNATLPVTVLCPGAEFGVAKKWPAARYAEVARAVLDAGGAVWILGSPNDVADADIVEAQAPGAVNLAGKTTLSDAIDLIAMADQAVCNDSGLMHVACALQVPTIGVFGSTSAQFTPPLGSRARVVELDLECRPCFARICPLGHNNCLNTLPASAVLEHLQPRVSA